MVADLNSFDSTQADELRGQRVTQLQFPTLPQRSIAFRPIHYLGSKLRLVSAVDALVARVAPAGRLCDLFAGSGTISVAAAVTRPVTSVDIQEYSRVVCSAMLLPPANAMLLGRGVASDARDSELMERLNQSLAPLFEYESYCVTRALTGDAEPLCNFVEHGSIKWFLQTGADAAAPMLRDALRLATNSLEANKLDSASGSLITRYFGGTYFSFRQAVDLDALLDAAHASPAAVTDAALAPILSTASETVNTIGKHFAQPIRPRGRDGLPKRHLVRQIINDRRTEVFSTHQDWVTRYAGLPRTHTTHEAVREDFKSFLASAPPDVGVFYADPPYTRDHYSRFYHVLETMCLRDEPDVSTSMIRTGGKPQMGRGFYRTDRHQSPFCIKSLAPAAFTSLFDGVRRYGVPLILSYSPYRENVAARPRLMSVDQLVALARSKFRSVEVMSAGTFAHSKLNIRERNVSVSWDAEVLVTCLP